MNVTIAIEKQLRIEILRLVFSGMKDNIDNIIVDNITKEYRLQRETGVD